MRRGICLMGVVASLAVACGRSVNVEQERSNLLALDREWSQSTKDTEKFLGYFAPDASVYPQGMPLTTGAAIRDTWTKMNSMPGFSVMWTATKAELSTSGDLGYTVGTYEMMMGGVPEKGKYITVWKKQPSGDWKVIEDIFNADASAMPSTPHVLLPAPSGITWGDAPPSLPPGARMAVISGDPSKGEPFVVRAQLPSGYRIPPHWHPTDEHLTVLSGTFSIGMGDSFNQGTMKDLTVGGYVALPAEMRHYAMAKGATTIQIHGMGPFAVNYVNPADDPRQQKK